MTTSDASTTLTADRERTLRDGGGAPRGCAVTLRGVRRVFEGGVEAVAGVDLDIRGGEFVALLGPSGSGKSTLLRLIAGLDRATAGEVTIAPPPPAPSSRQTPSQPPPPSPPPATADANSTRAPAARPAPAAAHSSPQLALPHRDPARPRMAFVFQDAHLLPWRTVLKNVALPLELQGVPKPERQDRAREAVEQVGLADAIRRYPAQLSGGMRMRASLARALVTDPQLLLLDEPFAALDEITRQQLDDQLRDLWTRRRMTVLFVTHSIVEATFLADRAVVFTRRPARVVLDHMLDLPPNRTPELRTDAQFAREMRRLFDALRHGQEAP